MKTDKRIAIKIGSNVIAGKDGLPDIVLLESITKQICQLQKEGVHVILISSGAVAAGKSIINLRKKINTVEQRQLLSSVGQVKLIQTYTELFEKEDQLCAQVLVTKQDFKDRQHYRNMQNCLNALLQSSIVPIINENDVVSVTELMFTDNDELAGLVSAMLNVNALYVLTNVDGVYNANPEKEHAEIISIYDDKHHDIGKLALHEKSNFGRGGIITKCNTSQKVANLGIPVTITNGRMDSVLIRLENGEKLGTFFPPKKSITNLKKWIAHSKGYAKGNVIVNEGAKKAIMSNHASSILPVGIVSISGSFQKGDVLRILDEKDHEIGLGMAKYNYKKAIGLIGLKNQKPLIHYDHLYIHEKTK